MFYIFYIFTYIHIYTYQDSRFKRDAKEYPGASEIRGVVEQNACYSILSIY